MSQRLTLKSSLQAKPRIIGWMNGCPVWSLQGAAPPDDDDPAGGGGGKDKEDKPGSEGQDDDDDPDKPKEDDKPPAGDGAVSREEYDKLFARMQAADRNATEAARKVKEYEDKDKSELEKATQRAEEAEAKLAEATAAVQAQAIRLAFVTGSDITWHDPEDALAFAMRTDELRELKVNEDGSVDKAVVKKAAADLAKSKPYLVKKVEKTDDDKDGDGDGEKPPSGHNPGGGKDKKSLEREALVSKYPALRR